MDAVEVICDLFRAEDVISVLTVGKVVTGEVRPREDYLIVHAVEFHVL